MAKAVIGEETRLKLAEDRLSQSARPSEAHSPMLSLSALGRAFIFDLVPTPLNDSGEPASALTEPDKKKGPKPKSKSEPADSSSLFIDKDWVAEHARQVSRMLVGGMKVVGLYVWVSDAAFKNSTIMLCQTVKGVADAAPVLEGDWDERLLLHICYSPRRRTSALTTSTLGNFPEICEIHRLSRLNLMTLSDALRHVISVHAKDLTGAKALIDGKLAIDYPDFQVQATGYGLLNIFHMNSMLLTAQVVDSESYSSDGVHEVELLLPFLSNRSIEGDVVGLLSFSGLICSFAYLNSKEPISQAVTDIKGDIIKSLQSRLDIICDEVDADSGNNHDEGRNEISVEKPVPQLVLLTLSLPFPRRVFAPWLAGVYVCDYLQPSETVEVFKDHCMELLSMKAPMDVSTILEPEKEVLSFKTKSFFDLAMPSNSEIHLMENKSKHDGGGDSSNSKSAKPDQINANITILHHKSGESTVEEMITKVKSGCRKRKKTKTADSEKMKSDSPRSVHESLMKEIQLKLPTKSELCFKCLSKSWFSLISDPQFARRRFDAAVAPTYKLLNVVNYSEAYCVDIESALCDDS
ncbi:hypothetical protein V8G54_006942 [Vigna mungo]|uniref:F-box protein n=1 Tax=Vigna mungo TaxID=3915 RepID=A0AAQ3P0X4_VIGMU